jgi:hypothetical protein
MSHTDLTFFDSVVPQGSAEVDVTDDLDSGFQLTEEDRLIILGKEENKEV